MECIRCDHYEEGVIKYCALLGQKLDYPREECDLLDDEANYNPDSEILANLINPGRNENGAKHNL